MTDFTIIKGGSPGKSKDNDEIIIEKFKMFMLHCRQIENAISTVHQMSKGFDWKELEVMTENSRIELRNMLTYVKRTYKDKLYSEKKKPKLELLINKLEEEKDGMGKILETMDTEDT